MRSWKSIIQEESEQPYWKSLTEAIMKDRQEHKVYPPSKELFRAFELCPLDKTRTVILAQDPYHGPGQAHGLAFSVNPGIDIPPSLRNIYKELVDDVGCSKPENGTLTGWARQGILLLNSSLTVRDGEANSHSKFGWQTFTDKIISFVNEKTEPVVFILWGANARKKKELINTSYHCVIESAHPSPLSAHNGFFGSKPFSKTNEFLIDQGYDPIDWSRSLE